MTQVSGTDVIRAAIANRIRHGAGPSLARDLSIGLGALEAFASGSARLPDAILDKLAGMIWPNAGFDPQQNLITRPQRPSTPLATFTPPPTAINMPKFSGKPPSAAPSTPSLPRTRPGWAAD